MLTVNKIIKKKTQHSTSLLCISLVQYPGDTDGAEGNKNGAHLERNRENNVLCGKTMLLFSPLRARDWISAKKWGNRRLKNRQTAVGIGVKRQQ